MKNTSVFLIDESLKSPFTLGVWKPIIVFPKNIFTQLTFDEKKAVLAHEMGHVLWKDNLMQWVLLFIHSLFWYIPLKSKLLKKAYHYREIGCDKHCHSKHLAEAIYKTAITPLPSAAIAFSTSFDRFHRALHSPQERKWIQIVSLFILLGGTLLIIMSEFLPF